MALLPASVQRLAPAVPAAPAAPATPALGLHTCWTLKSSLTIPVSIVQAREFAEGVETVSLPLDSEQVFLKYQPGFLGSRWILCECAPYHEDNLPGALQSESATSPPQ